MNARASPRFTRTFARVAVRPNLKYVRRERPFCYTSGAVLIKRQCVTNDRRSGVFNKTVNQIFAPPFSVRHARGNGIINYRGPRCTRCRGGRRIVVSNSLRYDRNPGNDVDGETGSGKKKMEKKNQTKNTYPPTGVITDTMLSNEK